MSWYILWSHLVLPVSKLWQEFDSCSEMWTFCERYYFIRLWQLSCFSSKDIFIEHDKARQYFVRVIIIFRTREMFVSAWNNPREGTRGSSQTIGPFRHDDNSIYGGCRKKLSAEFFFFLKALCHWLAMTSLFLLTRLFLLHTVSQQPTSMQNEGLQRIGLFRKPFALLVALLESWDFPKGTENFTLSLGIVCVGIFVYTCWKELALVVVLSETAAHTRFRSVFTEGFYFLVSR